MFEHRINERRSLPTCTMRKWPVRCTWDMKSSVSRKGIKNAANLSNCFNQPIVKKYNRSFMTWLKVKYKSGCRAKFQMSRPEVLGWARARPWAVAPMLVPFQPSSVHMSVVWSASSSLWLPYLSFGTFPSLRKHPYLGQMCELPILSISLHQFCAGRVERGNTCN